VIGAPVSSISAARPADHRREQRGLDDGGHAHPHLGEAERGARRRHAEIAGQRELEAGAEARPVHRGDHGERRAVHRRDRVVKLRDELAGAAGVQITQHTHVHAGGERAAVADDHRHPRRPVRRQLGERVAHGFDEGRLEEIQRRTIERAPDRGACPLEREWSPH
jgi:hypothetical protein